MPPCIYHALRLTSEHAQTRMHAHTCAHPHAMLGCHAHSTCTRSQIQARRHLLYTGTHARLALSHKHSQADLPCPHPHAPLKAGALLCFLSPVPFLDACSWSPRLLRASPTPEGLGSIKEIGSRQAPGQGLSFLPPLPGPPKGSPQAEVIPTPSSPPNPQVPSGGQCSICLYLVPCGSLGGGSSGASPFGVPACSLAEGSEPPTPFATWNPSSNTQQCVMVGSLCLSLLTCQMGTLTVPTCGPLED